MLYEVITSVFSALGFIRRTNLVVQIAIGMVCGIALAIAAPELARSVGLFGEVFISALKAVAPVLVFFLVAASIANHKRGQPTHIRPELVLS